METKQEQIIRQEIASVRSLANSMLDSCNRIERWLSPPPKKKKGGMSEIEKAEFLANYRKRFHKRINKKAASGN